MGVQFLIASLPMYFREEVYLQLQDLSSRSYAQRKENERKMDRADRGIRCLLQRGEPQRLLHLLLLFQRTKSRADTYVEPVLVALTILNVDCR